MKFTIPQRILLEADEEQRRLEREARLGDAAARQRWLQGQRRAGSQEQDFIDAFLKSGLSDVEVEHIIFFIVSSPRKITWADINDDYPILSPNILKGYLLYSAIENPEEWLSNNITGDNPETLNTLTDGLWLKVGASVVNRLGIVGALQAVFDNCDLDVAGFGLYSLALFSPDIAELYDVDEVEELRAAGVAGALSTALGKKLTAMGVRILGGVQESTIPQRVMLEADEERRRAERDAQISKSPEDAGRALILRVRNGDLRPENLQVAAALGDNESRAAAQLMQLEIPDLGDERTSAIWTVAFERSTLSTEEIFSFVCECAMGSDIIRKSPFLPVFTEICQGDTTNANDILSGMEAPPEDIDEIILVHLTQGADSLNNREYAISFLEGAMFWLLQPTYEDLEMTKLRFIDLLKGAQ